MWRMMRIEQREIDNENKHLLNSFQKISYMYYPEMFSSVIGFMI